MKTETVVAFVFLFLMLWCVLLGTAAESVKKNELWWCGHLAPKYQAEVEVRLDDGTRCDLLTESEAIEVDWARKYAEAIGQSWYYALKLDREPAIILLVKDPEKDQKYVDRCRLVCDHLGMHLYVEETQ